MDKLVISDKDNNRIIFDSDIDGDGEIRLHIIRGFGNSDLDDYINEQDADKIIAHLQKVFNKPSIDKTYQTQGEVMTFPVSSRVETPTSGKIESYFNGELLKHPVICGNVSYYTLENGDALKVKKDSD